MRTGCEEIQPLLAGYALSALDIDERHLVETHLEGCGDCQASLAEYQAVGEGLLHAPQPVQPPPRVRARLVARLAQEPVSVGRRGRWRALVQPWLVAALGLAALLLIDLGLMTQTRALIRDQQSLVAELRDEQRRLASQIRDDQAALAVMSYPGAQFVRVEGDGSYGTFVYDPDLEVAVLYAWELKPLASDQAYQAWLIEPGGGRVSAGVFQVEAGDRLVRLVIHSPGPLRDFVGMGVTIEPAEGSPGPTGPRVFGTDL